MRLQCIDKLHVPGLSISSYFLALRYNFDKVKEQTNSFNEAYDYASIMHYPWTAFASQRGVRTISARRRTNLIPYVALSDSDARQTKKMYKCDGEAVT